MKSIQIPYELWKKLKQTATDRDCTIWEVVKGLIEDCL